MRDRLCSLGNRGMLATALTAVLAVSSFAEAGEEWHSFRADPLVPPAGIEVAPQVIKVSQNAATYRIEPFESAVMTLGHRQGWKRIEWRENLATALEDAKCSGKPLVVVMINKEYGQNDSGFS